MKGKVVKELEINLEKEKYEFMNKFYFTQLIYDQDKVNYLKDYINKMLKRVELRLNNVKEKYNLIEFSDSLYPDSLDYVFNNSGLWIHNKYIIYLNQIRENLDIVDKEMEEGKYNPNEYALKIVDCVVNTFSLIEYISHDYICVDEKFFIFDLLESIYSLSRGVLFYGNKKDELVESFLTKLNCKNTYEVELKEDLMEANFEAFDFLKKLKYNEEKIVIVIKNINVALDNNELRSKLLLLLNNIYEDDNFIFLFTIDNIFEFSIIKELSKVHFTMNENKCLFHF